MIASRLIPFGGLAFVLTLAGCHARSAAANSRSQDQFTLATDREQMDLIPPPSKSRFMAVRSLDSWQNPYLVVQAGMVELHVTMGDANPSTFGAGGMLRPTGARRQELNVDLPKLAEAITAIPQGAWPYGRVVAVSEPTKTPPNVLPAVRRNIEAAVRVLNDIGVVAYDPSEGSLR